MNHADRRKRKNILRAVVRTHHKVGLAISTPVRWVHGVLYDSNDEELARLTPDAGGINARARRIPKTRKAPTPQPRADRFIWSR